MSARIIFQFLEKFLRQATNYTSCKMQVQHMVVVMVVLMVVVEVFVAVVVVVVVIVVVCVCVIGRVTDIGTKKENSL